MPATILDTPSTYLKKSTIRQGCRYRDYPQSCPGVRKDKAFLFRYELHESCEVYSNLLQPAYEGFNWLQPVFNQIAEVDVIVNPEFLSCKGWNFGLLIVSPIRLAGAGVH